MISFSRFATRPLAAVAVQGLVLACGAMPATEAAAQTSAIAQGAPRAAPRPVTDTYFGTTVTDSYRYLEDVKNPEVEQFMRSEGAAARQALDAIPGRAAIQSRIDALSQASVAISGVRLAGHAKLPRVFYYRLAPGEASRKLYVRDGYDGAERLVFDPAAISTGGRRFAIDFYRPSPNGRYVAVGVAAGGSEETSLRVVEVTASGARYSGVEIDRIGFADETHWAGDNRSFFYNRLPPQEAGAKKNRYLDSRAFRHVIGRNAARDEMVFGKGSTKVEFADIDIPGVEVAADGKTLIGTIRHGDAREISIYTADAGDFGEPLRWRRAIAPQDEVTAHALHANEMYLLSKKGAPRYKVMRMGSVRADYSKAIPVVAQSDAVISQIEAARDGLYVRQMLGGVDRLLRFRFSNKGRSGGKLESAPLPSDLAIRDVVTSGNRTGALVRLEGWTESPKYVAFDPGTGKAADTGLQPKSLVDFSEIVSDRVEATANDGVKVPISLVYRKSVSRNSDNPTFVRGYGAYGIVQAPFFNPSSLAWLERGGIIATCHVRGGGEFGEEWHRAGQKLNKPNTWRDLIACAEFLIEQRYTRTEKLAIIGGSAGGITVGRALTERPDLFAAVIPVVGVMDTLRAEFTPNGPPNIPEFGSVKTEDGFRGLLAMSSLHHVRDGTRYPAVLLMHGVNDPRVEVWQSTKMAARLQAATAGVANANPVLLRLDYDAGHGIGSTRNQRNAEFADIYSFALWQFGEPGFVPKP